MRQQNDMVFSFQDGSGNITVRDWYRGNDYQLQEIAFADGNVWKASDGQFLEAWFQEQTVLWEGQQALMGTSIPAEGEEPVESEEAGVMAAAELLTSESSESGFFDLDAQLNEILEESSSTTTAELNSTLELNDDQLAVDIAVASLQMEEDVPMIGGTEGTTSMTDESILAVSGASLGDAPLTEEKFGSAA